MSEARASERGAGEATERSLDDRRVIPAARVTSRTVGGAMVLLDTSTGRYFSLDDIGARAWAVLVTSPSMAHAFTVLLAEFQADPDRLRLDLEALVSRLSAQGLVEVTRAR